MKDFFAGSAIVDHLVTRPLSHIRANWELSWDHLSNRWESEDASYAEAFNALLDELARAEPPERYHDNEDRLATYVVEHLNWNIRKVGNRWTGAEYERILEQGGYGDFDQQELILAAAGRIQAARTRSQNHFDQMESSHQRMLGAVLSVILYHRSDYGR